MHRHIRILSIDDQKAIDVLLNHARTAADERLTRVADPVGSERMSAAKKVLSLLSEFPDIDLPHGLAEKTMRSIDRFRLNQKTGQQTRQAISPVAPPTTVH